MAKEVHIKKTYIIEVEMSGWANSEKYFDKVVAERVKELCIDTLTVGIHGSASVSTKKAKIVGVKHNA